MPAPNESSSDASSKLDQRIEATENTGSTRPDPELRRASNIRAYHQSQVTEARKTIAAHEEIIRQQNEILGVDEDVDTDTSTEPLSNGTDIAERFNTAFDAIYTVEELQEELREYGLPTSGNKSELIERLVAYHNDELDEDEDDNTPSDQE